MNEKKYLVVFHAEDGNDYFEIYENLQDFLSDDKTCDRYGNFTWSGMNCDITALDAFLSRI